MIVRFNEGPQAAVGQSAYAKANSINRMTQFKLRSAERAASSSENRLPVFISFQNAMTLHLAF
ncbi:hypothetical protein DLM45_04630 [Hyphomicrobium methylovorum]|nr:hypothetical protein [Hyphomicrobium methylovorum]